MGALLREDKVDAIICVAGGWAGGNAASAGESSLSLLSTVLRSPPSAQPGSVQCKLCVVCVSSSELAHRPNRGS